MNFLKLLFSSEIFIKFCNFFAELIKNSKIIQISIAIGIVVLSLSFGASLLMQVKSGKCFTNVLREIKQIINEAR